MIEVIRDKVTQDKHTRLTSCSSVSSRYNKNKLNLHVVNLMKMILKSSNYLDVYLHTAL